MGNYFVKNLKYLRKRKNISQNRLAELSKVNQTTITRWESNEMSPSIDNVNDVANALGVSVADLLGKDLSETEDYNELDEILFSKAKDLSDKDKEVIIRVIDSIKKSIDEQE